MPDPILSVTRPDGRAVRPDAPAAAHPFGPPAAAGEVGTLGPYRVVRRLGHGGMGVVYLAVDARLDRRVALKVMLPRFAADPAARGRFLREAWAAAGVTHDNVVTVYEADERDGVPYIAMQFLEGYPLDEYLTRGWGLSVPQVLRVAREAAAGLAAAHAAGLVHRDVKPANLWLEAPDGRVKVLDFGLAKPVDAAVELTRRGAVIGTPAFMAPEQARGERVDARADLFSLGGVLYRLCTGRLPFDGPSTMAVLTALATADPPPVRGLNPEVPEALADLIHHLLAKAAADRPRSAAEVVRRVQEMADPTAGPEAARIEVPDAVPVRAEAETASVTRVPEAVLARGWTVGRRAWMVAGAVALLAVAGAYLARDTGGPGPAPVDGGGGAPVAPVPPKGELAVVAVAVADPERAAAEWVLSVGGSVRVEGGDRDLRATADLPAGRFVLTRVDLARSSAADADLTRFKDCPRLAWLRLDKTGVTDVGLAGLVGCKGLTHLWLSRTGVSDGGLPLLADLPELKHLDLSGTAVTGRGLSGLAACRWLAGLDLSGSGVTDDGLEHLAGCERLSVLDLAGTGVTDAGLAKLGGCRRLAELCLDRTPVTDDGLAGLSTCAALRVVNAYDTGVTGKGAAALRAALPGCEEVWYGPSKK